MRGLEWDGNRLLTVAMVGDSLKIRVNRITNGIVHGNTPFGSINVIWHGDNPELGKVYDVELDIDKVLVWGKDVLLANSGDFAIVCNGGSTMLHGVLESVDADGYAVLRMGDYIIPFVAKGVYFDIDSRIIVCIDSISASPISY